MLQASSWHSNVFNYKTIIIVAVVWLMLCYLRVSTLQSIFKRVYFTINIFKIESWRLTQGRRIVRSIVWAPLRSTILTFNGPFFHVKGHYDENHSNSNKNISIRVTDVMQKANKLKSGHLKHSYLWTESRSALKKRPSIIEWFFIFLFVQSFLNGTNPTSFLFVFVLSKQTIQF